MARTTAPAPLRPGPAYGIELQGEGDATRPPEWILLVPAEQTIVGRDGRAITNPGAATIMRSFRERRVDLCVDTDHALERMWSGRDTAANGWVVELRERAGAVEGRVEWTELGRRRLMSREYRYHSPVYYVERDRNNAIARVDSVSLTNKPNLFLPALNSEEDPVDENQGVEDRLKALEDQLAKGGEASAHSADSATDKRLAALEARLNNERLKNVVRAGVTAGKILPAGEQEVVAMMADATPERIDALEKWLDGAPKAVGAGTVLPAGEPKPHDEEVDTPERREVREAMGKAEPAKGGQK